ncbi:MAG TPA: cardiolipin synthase [Planctomycetota bacterium]|nr:cardiolipin synthase [Planctomycetota bacterium]
MTVAFSIIVTAAGYLIGISLIPRILLERKESGATLAWLLAIIFLPYIGAFAFWAIGTPRVRFRRRKRQRALAHVAPGLEQSTRCVSRFEDKAQESALAELPEPCPALAALATRMGRPSSGGNTVELLLDGEATFSRIRSAIQSASSHVNVEYYIWRDDDTGRALRDLLVDVQKAGVQVRVLVDDVGSREANLRFFRPLLNAGGKVARFLRVNLLARRLVINNRNHRKIVVVDGLLAFTGGLNVGNEYLGKDGVFARWRDTHVRIEGPAALRLQEVFVEDWFHASGEDLAESRFFPDPVPSGNDRVHIISSGPDDGRAHSIATIIFAACALARKRVWLTTPYFVPDLALVTALKMSALRGADVRLLLPSKLDEPFVLHAARSFYPDLLDAGVRIFEFEENAMLHSKTAVIDSCWATVGSANLDLRSFYLNFETNAVVYGSVFARELERAFERDTTQAREVHRSEFGRHRPWLTRTAEGAAKILSPLL